MISRSCMMWYSHIGLFRYRDSCKYQNHRQQKNAAFRKKNMGSRVCIYLYGVNRVVIAWCTLWKKWGERGERKTRTQTTPRPLRTTRPAQSDSHIQLSVGPRTPQNKALALQSCHWIVIWPHHHHPWRISWMQTVRGGHGGSGRGHVYIRPNRFFCHFKLGVRLRRRTLSLLLKETYR